MHRPWPTLENEKVLGQPADHLLWEPASLR